jgi:hypothetical protein
MQQVAIFVHFIRQKSFLPSPAFNHTPGNFRAFNPPGSLRVGFVALTAKAHVTRTFSPGQIFIPMQYAKTNRLTFAWFGPHSRQPSCKACAVRLEAV